MHRGKKVLFIHSESHYSYVLIIKITLPVVNKIYLHKRGRVK